MQYLGWRIEDRGWKLEDGEWKQLQYFGQADKSNNRNLNGALSCRCCCCCCLQNNAANRMKRPGQVALFTGGIMRLRSASTMASNVIDHYSYYWQTTSDHFLHQVSQISLYLPLFASYFSSSLLFSSLRFNLSNKLSLYLSISLPKLILFSYCSKVMSRVTNGAMNKSASFLSGIA